ncbi:hypothetical protein [Rhodopirellula sp. MGV]|uniref:hypothetical protein n=1 Tax=Rhodopirellula sp. MGV TaxID=2023130 RepID=UPI000B961C0D|nr:hypothetical protein [Rhodopirellula sp. MGV]OYP31685.1 hypothetical protein CGZ80_20525 [Rhodopirellula sp. MGV]PNY33986.1 hypothetical protein C2E31_25470 [Rhodopirellula baltica]
MRKLLLLLACVATFSVATSDDASAVGRKSMTQRWSHNFAMDRPWHGGYYQQNYNQPLAVVVPPTAHMRTNYAWGVSQNTMYPIHHQFGRSAPGIGAAPAGQLRPTPAWPSHTDQFGYYYIRAPW